MASWRERPTSTPTMIARAEHLARLAVARDDVLAPRQMHAVGAQRARELRVASMSAAMFLGLGQLDERARLYGRERATIAPPR